MVSDHEQERFLRLWADAQPAVAAFLHSVVRDAAAAKDLLQETALVLFRRFGDYDGQRPFLAWALGVAKLQVLGFRRDVARSPVTFDTELLERFTAAWAEQAPAASQQSVALELCLERMAPRPRQLLRWRYFEDVKSEDIASRLGSNGAAVRVMLQRLREQLRACVEKQLRMEGGSHGWS